MNPTGRGMVHLDRLLISRRPYALCTDPAGLRVTSYEATCGRRYRSELDAVWFRRRGGKTVVRTGFLWTYDDEPSADWRDFPNRHTDGRHGVECLARWDGSNLWTSGVSNTVAQAILEEVLRPALDAYPAVPDGCDGWWAFDA